MVNKDWNKLYFWVMTLEVWGCFQFWPLSLRFFILVYQVWFCLAVKSKKTISSFSKLITKLEEMSILNIKPNPIDQNEKSQT